MSQPEETQEKTAKTDAVLRPPAAIPSRIKRRPEDRDRNRPDDGPARPVPESAEEG